jgi:hypothetical protein
MNTGLIENKDTILKLHATLTKIANKQPVFFNVANFEKWGLVRVHGLRNDNTPNWVLTEKAKRFLTVQL